MAEASAYAAAAVLGIALFGIAIIVGERLQLLDYPGEVKPHARPIPYMGGLPLLILGVAGGLLAGLPVAALLGLFLTWLVGFVDDVRRLAAWQKSLLLLPGLAAGGLQLGLDSSSLSAGLILGFVLVNAFNVIDGLDGLAGGTALIGLLALLTNPGPYVLFVAAVAGGVTTFLLFNLPPARLFLGDQGSLLLGYLLWLVPLALYGMRPSSDRVAAGLLLWSFPILNMGFVVIRRLVAGRSLTAGRRDHLYDVLSVRYGLAKALAICWSVAAIGAISSAGLSR